MIEWDDYLHRNQIDSDCQLVTIANAHIFYYHNKLNMDDYKMLSTKCGCDHGACIDTSHALKHYGLEIDKTYQIWELDQLLNSNIFFEISVWHKYFGFHSVACIDYSRQCDALRITNFKHVTSMNGWIFKEDLKPHIVDNPNREGWCFRTFKEKNYGK